MTKNILIVTSEFPPSPGGIGNHAWNLANSFSSKNWKVTVLTEIRKKNNADWDSFLLQSNFRIVGINRNSFILITYLKRIFFYLYLIMSIDKPSVIYSGKFSVWLSGIIKLSTPTLAVIHGSEIKSTGILKFLFNRGLLNVRNIVSVSNFTQVKLLENFNLDRNKCLVINNGFKFDTLKIDRVCNDELTFITIGGMHRRKGQHLFIKALPTLITKYQKIRYIIAGIPQEINSLEKLVRELNVENNVDFHIMPENNKLADLLSKSKIFVMLSENLANGDFEGFGIAILEAMSLGIPALGSRNTGIEDAISDYYSGILVDNKNLEEINNAIELILNNYEFYSTNALNWSRNFVWSKIITKYEKLV